MTSKAQFAHKKFLLESKLRLFQETPKKLKDKPATGQKLLHRIYGKDPVFRIYKELLNSKRKTNPNNRMYRRFELMFHHR